VVFEWLFGKSKRKGSLTLPDREVRVRNTGEVNLKPYTPELKQFLGQLAYLQLSNFEILTNELKFSPNISYKAELSEAATKSFDKYRQIAKRLVAAGFDVTEAMDSYTERISTFNSSTKGIDWYENILKVYLVSGLLDDFYRQLAVGLDAISRADVEKALNDKTIEKFAKHVLIEAMADDAKLASRLALWGRRLMGDVLLQVRAAFDNDRLAGTKKGKSLSEADAKKVNLAAYMALEPLINQLVSAHSTRMDALGLTA
jgi:hypothetical protein